MLFDEMKDDDAFPRSHWLTLTRRANMKRTMLKFTCSNFCSPPSVCPSLQVQSRCKLERQMCCRPYWDSQWRQDSEMKTRSPRTLIRTIRESDFISKNDGSPTKSGFNLREVFLSKVSQNTSRNSSSRNANKVMLCFWTDMQEWTWKEICFIAIQEILIKRSAEKHSEKKRKSHESEGCLHDILMESREIFIRNPQDFWLLCDRWSRSLIMSRRRGRLSTWSEIVQKE